MSGSVVSFVRKLLRKPKWKHAKSLEVEDVDIAYRQAYSFLYRKRGNKEVGITKDPSKPLLWFWKRKKS